MIERVVIALANSHNDPARAAAYVREHWGAGGAEFRALSSDQVSAGGALVGEEIDAQFIHALRDRSVVRRMGASRTSLRASKRAIRFTSGAVAYWIGQNEVIPASQPTLGNVNLDERKLGTFVPISNSLRRGSPALAEEAVRQDMLLAAAAAEDVSFIRGDGTEYSPTGMRHLAAAANVIVANATVNLANVITDLTYAMAAVEDEKVPMLRPGWLMSPRSRRYLATVRTAADGPFAFKDEMAAGTLLGYPFASTTAIPDNLGGGGDGSEIYFADFSELVIGDGDSRVDVEDGAAYVQSAVLKAAFSEDVSCARHIRAVDFSTKHEEAIAVLTAVKWGA